MKSLRFCAAALLFLVACPIGCSLPDGHRCRNAYSWWRGCDVGGKGCVKGKANCAPACQGGIPASVDFDANAVPAPMYPLPAPLPPRPSTVEVYP